MIPARGGSKRIPGKNIREFFGVPALGRVIQLVAEAAKFDWVVVSTDSPEIAAVARKFGADVHVRASDLADDHVGLLEVVQGALPDLESTGVTPDVVACVLPTAVLMDPGDLAKGLSLVKDGHAKFVSSVGRFSYPIQRALRVRGDLTLEMVWPENYQARSQDLESLYHDAGQMYVGTCDQWMKRSSVFDHQTMAIIIEDWRVQDIDVEEDWIRAELMWRISQDPELSKSSSASSPSLLQ